MTRWLRSLGSRCAARPLVVVVSWLVVAAVVTLVSLTLGGDYSHSSTLPGTEVQTAEALLARHLPAASHEIAVLVVEVTDPPGAPGAPGRGASQGGAAVAVRGTAPAGARAARAVGVARVSQLPQVAPAPPAVRWSADEATSLVRVEYAAGRFEVGHSALKALRRAVRSVPG